MVNLTLTLTKTLELNLNRLSYWDCCRNIVRKKKFAAGSRHQYHMDTMDRPGVDRLQGSKFVVFW